MSPAGRPRLNDPKTNRFSVCLDKETEEKLRVYCREHNITKSEAVRQGIHLLLQQEK